MSVPATVEQQHGPPTLFKELKLDSWQLRWLKAYALTGGVRAASRKAAVDSSYHYDWLRTSSDYSLGYQLAREAYADTAEGEIRRRGIEGTLKPLSYKGKLTGDKIREYSDPLALAVVKALKPEYRDGQQLTVGPTKISIEIATAEVKSDATEIVIKSSE